MTANLFGEDQTTQEIQRQVARIHRDKSAPPCPHGFAFITQCLKCTPPLEKDERQKCIEAMRKLGWRHVSFSQPFKAAQTKGISDDRFYPPEWNPKGHKPFWFECKRVMEKTNTETKKGQAAFRALAESCGEDYVRGGLIELAAFLRERKIAEVGLR